MKKHYKNLINENVHVNLLQEATLIYSNRVKVADMPKIIHSSDCADYFRTIWGNDLEMCESFFVLLLNRSNRVMGWVKISQGGLVGTVADSRLIFSAAISGLATSIVIAHNHPSGNLNPSGADVSITKKLKEGGLLLEIPVLDHIILTADSYYSFADNGKV